MTSWVLLDITWPDLPGRETGMLLNWETTAKVWFLGQEQGPLVLEWNPATASPPLKGSPPPPFIPNRTDSRNTQGQVPSLSGHRGWLYSLAGCHGAAAWRNVPAVPSLESIRSQSFFTGLPWMLSCDCSKQSLPPSALLGQVSGPWVPDAGSTITGWHSVGLLQGPQHAEWLALWGSSWALRGGQEGTSGYIGSNSERAWKEDWAHRAMVCCLSLAPRHPALQFSVYRAPVSNFGAHWSATPYFGQKQWLRAFHVTDTLLKPYVIWWACPCYSPHCTEEESGPRAVQYAAQGHTGEASGMEREVRCLLQSPRSCCPSTSKHMK